MADKSAKTEQPTQRRLENARKEGQFASAKEFVSALQFLVFLSLMAAGGASWFAQFRISMRDLLLMAFAPDLHQEDLMRIVWQTVRKQVLPLVMAGMAVAVATVGFRLLTTRGGISFKKLMPDAARFNPIQRLADIPKQNLPSLGQAMVLLPVFLWAVWVIARERLDAFMTLPLQSVESGVGLVGSSLMELFWKASGVFLVFGCVDLFRQMRRHKHDLMMT